MSRIQPPPSRRKFRLGDVYEESLSIFTPHSLRLTTVALIVYGFLALVDALTDAAGGGKFLLTLVAVVITVIGVFRLQGALAMASDRVTGSTMPVSA